MAVRALQDDNVGLHNADLEKSTSRIVRGGTYKKQRVILLVPAIAPIPPRIYLSHCSLIFPPNQAAHRMLCLGDEVGIAYSNAIADILAHPDLREWEYICTLESDNAPPNDGLIKLIARMEQHPELAAIGGLYWTKGFEHSVCQRWGDVNDPVTNFRPQPPPPPGQLGECAGLGMGFTLHRMSMFKDERIERPWFKTIAGREGVGTQDLSFWAKARRLGYRCAVDADVLVGHYDYATDTMF